MNKSILIIILLFLLVYVAPLGFRPLFQPDETRYAEIAREMLQSGNYVTPHLDGLRYFEKPVFGYWLFAGSLRLFGENAFALRLPCALAAGLAALSLFLFARRFAGGELPGTIVAAIYLSMPFVFILANIGILDSILCALLTAALCHLYCALMEDFFTFRKVFHLVLCGLFCGFAFMTKGFLAFAAPALVVSAFLIWERRWLDFVKLPWIPAFAALLAALPWALAIQLEEPGFWRYFFWVEHIQRFFTDSYQHSEPCWFFIPVFLGGAATWLFLFPSTLLGLKETGTKNPLVKYCICWLALPFLFFSASTGKLAPYILPCFAPLSLLILIGLHKCSVKGWTAWFHLCVFPLTCLVGLATAGFIINQLTGFPATLFSKTENVKWCIGAVAGLLCLLALASALKTQDFWRKIAFFCLAPAPLFFAFNFILPDIVAERKAPAVFLERNARLLAPETALVSWRDPAQSVAWVFKRNDVWLYLSGGELDDGLKFKDSRHRLLSREDLKSFVESRRAKGGVALILPVKILEEERAEKSFPTPEWIKAEDTKGYAIVKF